MSGSGFPVTLLDLAGSIALLLWGLRMVQTGVQRAFGARLRSALSTALRTPSKAFLTGLGVTAVLQSSTATGLMVSGFAAGGLVDLVPALAVMLGANVGTTLIVQLLSFDLSPVTPVLILIGVLMFRRGQASRTHDLGRVAIGLGLMLLALHQLLELVTPFEDAPSLRLMLGAIAAQQWLDVIVAAGLTWAAHSSVAIVLLVMSLATKGVVPPDAAFALVLGANLGTAINPLLETSEGKDAAARRVPAGNLGTRAVGVALGLAMLPKLGEWLVTVLPDPARAVADFHLGFNLVVAALFFPVLPSYAKLLRRLFPTRVDAPDPSRPVYLDEAAREAPVVAIGAAAREALRLADMLETMLLAARDAFATDERKRVAAVRRMDDVLDRLNHAIKTYLTGLDAESTSDADQRRIEQILAFTINLEHAGDVVDKPVRSCRQAAEAEHHPLAGAERGTGGHYFSTGDQPARGGICLYDGGRASRARAGGRKGGIPQPGSGRDRGSFRANSRWPGSGGGTECVAARSAARSETRQRPLGRGGGVSGSEGSGRTAADAAT